MGQVGLIFHLPLASDCTLLHPSSNVHVKLFSTVMSSILLTLAPWFHTFSMWSCFHHVHYYNQWQNLSRCLFCRSHPYRVHSLISVHQPSFHIRKGIYCTASVLSIFQHLSCKGCPADADQGRLSWQVVMLQQCESLRGWRSAEILHTLLRASFFMTCTAPVSFAAACIQESSVYCNSIPQPLSCAVTKVRISLDSGKCAPFSCRTTWHH